MSSDMMVKTEYIEIPLGTHPIDMIPDVYITRVVYPMDEEIILVPRCPPTPPIVLRTDLAEIEDLIMLETEDDDPSSDWEME